MNDFYEQHFEDCDYCLEVSESKLTESEKSRLIDAHTTDAYAGMADLAYDRQKDEAYATT